MNAGKNVENEEEIRRIAGQSRKNDRKECTTKSGSHFVHQSNHSNCNFHFLFILFLLCIRPFSRNNFIAIAMNGIRAKCIRVTCSNCRVCVRERRTCRQFQWPPKTPHYASPVPSLEAKITNENLFPFAVFLLLFSFNAFPSGNTQSEIGADVNTTEKWGKTRNKKKKMFDKKNAYGKCSSLERTSSIVRPFVWP